MEIAISNKMKFKTLYVDPPWQQPMMPILKRRPHTAKALPYKTMSLAEIQALNVGQLADVGCHLWLWTTNKFLHPAFHIIEAWGFKYMMTITWVKKSGCGIYFASTTQHLLFAYYKKCYFNRARYRPTHFITPPPRRHSQKPDEAYELIEAISEPPRLELFARKQRQGWSVWGNEVESSFQLETQ